MNPCLNGGVCLINPTSNYGYCSCKLGFTGKYCESKIECPPNFYSDDCSVKCIAVDNCEIHQACDYYGRLKCRDGWGSFPECNKRLINPSIDCECPIISNFSVSTSPCFNGGSCWQGTCCCPPGYTGLRCEKFIDLCQPSPCLNGALCVSAPNNFLCKCKSGYSGVYCQNFIDPCRNSTLQCSGSGVCVPLPDYSGFNCSCLEGYTGVYCEKQIDYCSSRPCLNDGTCVSLFRNYYCTCAPG
jgi:Notch-like protein